ncbi:TonB-dependent receptor [Actomonas aquatica]|uniref:TonB-dependent receptor n=1 Tax=Actomonas aquatica TaxID=2866162 RepID=A0ABZ1CDD9_9BACT|nr:TonB-dependent receptor [Opitutus sp. WL0086]WRQ89698.1 TonB-dependent receptor [Opitutus sp. WL0086]
MLPRWTIWICAFTVWQSGFAQVPASLTPEEGEPVQTLDAFEVRTDELEDAFDETGMGYLDAERRDPPFSNDLIFDADEEDELGSDVEAELGQIAVTSAADLATGSDRLNLRGFPTPRLRNAFVQTGIPEVLEVKRRETIQGALTSVTGRAAPGGIQNYMTARPPGRAMTRWDASASTDDIWRVRVEKGGPVAKWGKTKVFQRVALSYERREGSEAFAYRDNLTLSGALTLRHSRAHSTLWQIDYAAYDGNPSPGVPGYRESANGLVLGPYLPMADFHTYGPNAGVSRHTANFSFQYEGQTSKALSTRASVQGLVRELEEDRFTRGDYLLDQGRFAGTRQPQHIAQPLRALAVDGDLTWRFDVGDVSHKLLVSSELVSADSSRLQRGLDAEELSALPLSVRRFDPAAPDWFRPALSAASYRRIINDREEVTRYWGNAISERAAIGSGRVVLTAGLRHDRVDLELTDEAPNAPQPAVSATTHELTYHVGGNVIAVPGRLLVYANTSTAFEPSTRVDRRTGDIQGNETTGGVEAGLKGMGWDRRLSFTLHGFSFVNRNISRRNPLYRDPIADADQTQPELIAAGRERFQGATLDVRLKPAGVWQVQGKVAFTDSITERSPDLPQEEGRAIARVPRWTGALSGRLAWQDGALAGWNASTSLVYMGSYVQRYEDTRYAELDYPGYVTLALGLGYQWRTGDGKQRHDLSLRVQNALDEDLLVRAGRVGAGRSARLGYRWSY